MKFLQSIFGGKPAQTTAELVAQIHGEFRSAGDELLAQANALFDAKSPFLRDKAKRLREAGFGSTEEAKRSEAHEAELNAASDLYNLVQNYRLRYPANHFITRAQVDTIAAKYNLVVGPTSAYTGFVPDAKLREISTFRERFKTEDVMEDMIRVTKWAATTPKKEMLITAFKRLHPNGLFPQSILTIGTVFTWVEFNGETLFVDQYERVNQQDMLIAAPRKDMQLEGLKEVNGIFARVVAVEIPDPVVLQPVKGGFLIVALWGDEASDPLLVNPQHN